MKLARAACECEFGGWNPWPAPMAKTIIILVKKTNTERKGKERKGTRGKELKFLSIWFPIIKQIIGCTSQHLNTSIVLCVVVV